MKASHRLGPDLVAELDGKYYDHIKHNLSAQSAIQALKLYKENHTRFRQLYDLENVSEFFVLF